MKSKTQISYVIKQKASSCMDFDSLRFIFSFKLKKLMKDFKKLNVWQKSIELVTSIYKISKRFPAEEKYGLKSQITRAAVSIPSNIAEGSSRHSEKDYYRFLEIALGSAFELETQLIIIEKLEIVNVVALENIIDETKSIQKMLTGLMRKLNRA